MKFLPRFSLRALCVFVTVIACVLGGMKWVSFLFSINPSSEQVFVNGKSVEIPWQPIKWEPGHSSVGGDTTWILSDPGHLPVDRDLMDPQRLLVILYDSHFGSHSFQANASISGHVLSDHEKYVLFPSRSGGGSSDGGSTCNFDFDHESKLLTLNITQWINPRRVAKKATLKFMLVEQKFQYVETNSASPPQ